MSGEPWRDRAACRDADPDLFFPGRGDRVRADAAREVCRRCPVRQSCLDFAIANQIRDGIWGGLAGRERRQLRASRQRAARRDRDQAIAAARDAGQTAAAIGRAFGLSRTSVVRVLSQAAARPGRPG